MKSDLIFFNNSFFSPRQEYQKTKENTDVRLNTCSVSFFQVCFPGCRVITTTWWRHKSVHCVRNMEFLMRWNPYGEAWWMLWGKDKEKQCVRFMMLQNQVIVLIWLPEQQGEDVFSDKTILLVCLNVYQINFYLILFFRSLKKSGDLWLDAYLHKWQNGPGRRCCIKLDSTF